MAKPTVHDIAKQAGVSLATVDRVLNDRPGVRATTVERVRRAVDELGYVRDTYAANLARRRQYRFAFLLPEGPGQFVGTLRAALAAATAAQTADRLSAQVIPVPVHDPHRVARILSGLSPKRHDGVAIMAPETPQLRDAVLHLKAQGMAVVALVSNLPNSGCDHFIGIDSLRAGRTAGVLMGRFLGPAGGAVQVVTDSLLARDSVERRLGFDAVLADGFPRVEVLPTVEWHGDPERMAAILARVLARHRELAGVYSMGPGTPALLAALEAEGRARDLVVIVHELTPATRAGLAAGRIDAVIAQNVGHLVRSALRILRAKCDGAPIFEDQETIRIEIVIRENLPDGPPDGRGGRRVTDAQGGNAP